MARWEPGARERLEEAAFALFGEQGFTATTVPQIAARAGLTTRTFFRHFADKREVVFADGELTRMARELLAAAPPDQHGMPLLLGALRAVAEDRFEGRRERVRAVRQLIRDDPAVAERDAAKRAALVAAARDGLVTRGEPPLVAETQAELSMLALTVAIGAWLDDPGEAPLFDHILVVLRLLATELGPVTGTEAVRGAGPAAAGEPSDAGTR